MHDQECFYCTDYRQRAESAEAEVVKLQAAIERMQTSHEQMVDDRRLLERDLMRHRRETDAIRRQLKESSEALRADVREVCEHHAKRWREWFPRATGLMYVSNGKRAKAVARALAWEMPDRETRDMRLVRPADCKLVIDGAFASEFHREKRAYLDLDSIFRDEKRFQQHLERAEIYAAQEAYRDELQIRKQIEDAGSAIGLIGLTMERMKEKGTLTPHKQEQLESMARHLALVDPAVQPTVLASVWPLEEAA